MRLMFILFGFIEFSYNLLVTFIKCVYFFSLLQAMLIPDFILLYSIYLVH